MCSWLYFQYRSPYNEHLLTESLQLYKVPKQYQLLVNNPRNTSFGPFEQICETDVYILSLYILSYGFANLSKVSICNISEYIEWKHPCMDTKLCFFFQNVLQTHTSEHFGFFRGKYTRKFRLYRQVFAPEWYIWMTIS